MTICVMIFYYSAVKGSCYHRILQKQLDLSVRTVYGQPLQYKMIYVVYVYVRIPSSIYAVPYF